MQAFYLANRFHDHLARRRSASPTGLRGRRPAAAQTDDGAATGPDDDHINNANMYTPPDGTSPMMQMYLWQRRRYRRDERRRRRRRSSTTSTRTGSRTGSSRDADGAGALNSRAGGRDGRGLERLVRARTSSSTQFPALDTGAPGEVHMGDYTDVAARTRSARRRSTARSAPPPPLPGVPARHRRLHLRRLRPDRRRRRGPRRRRDLGRDAVGPAHRARLAEARAR